MGKRPTSCLIARRDWVKLSGAALAPPGAALAQAPKRGGTLTIRAWDPPHFDPYLIIGFHGPNLGFDYGGRFMAAWLDR